MIKTLSSMADKAVFFDLDDTLYKEIDFVRSAFSEISLFIEKEYGRGGLLDEMMSLRDRGLDVFGEIIGKYNLCGLTKETLLGIYRNHYPDIRLSSDSVEILCQLREEGSILGIITDGRSLSQRNKIKALGLSAYVDDINILISEEIGGEKLSGHPFKIASERYPDHELWYIGDNVEKDFAPAKLYGFCTVGIADDGRNIHHVSPQDSSAEPDYWVNGLSELELCFYHDGFGE